MRVLLSTVGTRGDVQPLIALAVELRELRQDVRLCIPPDFLPWAHGLGFDAVSMGPELRTALGGATSAPPSFSPEGRNRLADAVVTIQFVTLASAAAGCDAIVAGGLQVAARSVAERLGIGYLFVAFCPVVLPSAHHPPLVLNAASWAPHQPPEVNRAAWRGDGERFAAAFGPPLNVHRAAVGLPPIDDVRGYVLTERPLLAADPVLAPWPADEPDENGAVAQTGAWLFADERRLSPDLEAFLDAGDPPVYFGFSSMQAPPELAAVMLGAARAAGRRAIVSRGWAGFSPVDAAKDWISVDDVNHAALFGRVAAVVHHGGAGTTTAAAVAGAPQLVIPQFYDQPYWAHRVGQLGIGRAHPPVSPTEGSLAAGLQDVLRPDVSGQARDIARAMHRDGARHAAMLIASRAAAPPAPR